MRRCQPYLYHHQLFISCRSHDWKDICSGACVHVLLVRDCPAGGVPEQRSVGWKQGVRRHGGDVADDNHDADHGVLWSGHLERPTLEVPALPVGVRRRRSREESGRIRHDHRGDADMLHLRRAVVHPSFAHPRGEARQQEPGQSVVPSALRSPDSDRRLRLLPDDLGFDGDALPLRDL